jgi:hypothetical protein
MRKELWLTKQIYVTALIPLGIPPCIHSLISLIFESEPFFQTIIFLRKIIPSGLN